MSPAPTVEPSSRQSVPVAGRSCDGCTLCCKLLGIEELEKPPAIECEHCTTGTGCRIYAGRPTECRGFHCEYLLDPKLGEEWRPSRSHMVVAFEDYSNSIVIHVDASDAMAWRAEPFQSRIRQWAAQGAAQRTQVIVWQGETRIAIAGTLAPIDGGVAP